MKLLLINFFVVLMAFNVQGQNYDKVIPVEESVEQKEIKDGTYFKDVNHIFNRYKGNWSGTSGNKEYKIVLEKETEEVNYIAQIKEDYMLMRYKITQNGNEIINTLALPNDNGFVSSGYYLQDRGAYFEYSFVYSGKEIKCGQSGFILLRTTDDSDKLKLKLHPEGGIILTNDCPDGAAEQVFPTDEWLVLKKEK